MPKVVQRRRGTTVQHATFTGLSGELTVDTTKNVVVAHDGITAGGHPMLKALTFDLEHTTSGGHDWDSLSALESISLTSAITSADSFGLYDKSGTKMRKVTPLNLRNYLDVVMELLGNSVLGLGISNAADADHDITIAAGSARDTTNIDTLVLAAAITKRLDASWAVGTGNGGLDTGSIDASKAYAVWLIKRSDTGVVDALLSLSGTAPTMPAGYDLKRRVGWITTDSSANIFRFKQRGDRFDFVTLPGKDMDSVACTSTVVNVTSMCAPDVVGIFGGYMYWQNDANPEYTRFYPTDIDDETVTISNAQLFSRYNSTTGITLSQEAEFQVYVDSSRQYTVRSNQSAASSGVFCWCKGWIDDRRI